MFHEQVGQLFDDRVFSTRNKVPHLRQSADHDQDDVELVESEQFYDEIDR